MRELQREKGTLLIAPQTVAGNASATANFDGKGSRSVDIVVSIGALKNTSGLPPATIKLSESDDTVVTNFSDITGATANAALGASASVRFNVDLTKRKRYIKLTVTTATSTNDDQIVCATARATRLEQDPGSTSDFGESIVKIV